MTSDASSQSIKTAILTTTQYMYHIKMQILKIYVDDQTEMIMELKEYLKCLKIIENFDK